MARHFTIMDLHFQFAVNLTVTLTSTTKANKNVARSETASVSKGEG
jgi:hypothetical protein